MNKINIKINKLTKVIFIILCIFSAIARIGIFLDYFKSNVLVMIIALFCLLAALYLLITKLKIKLKNFYQKFIKIIDKLSYKKMVIIIVVVSLITKLLFLFAFQIDSTKHSDISMYWSFIKQLNDNGIIVENNDYALKWSHTVIMSLFYLLPSKVLGTNSAYPYVVFNSIMLTTGSYLVFSTITYLKNKNLAFISVMLWILIPVGIMQPSMLVHENTLIFVHSLVFYLYFKFAPSFSNKYLKYIIILFVFTILSFESLINQFAIVAIIAFIIDIFVKNYKLVIKFLLVLFSLLSLLVGNKFKSYYLDAHVMKSDVDYSLTIPYGWTFYLGLNYETGGYYSSSDADEWNKYENTNDAELIITHENELISERISEYISNPAKIFIHFMDKMKIISSDFNPAGYKGKDGKCFGNELCQAFNDSKIDTILYIVMSFINVVLSFLLLYLCVKNYRQFDDSYIMYSKLFIIGVTAILLFIEVMPKYSSHLVMIYLWILAYSLSNMLCS